MEKFFDYSGELLLVNVRVQPGASRTELGTVKDGRLKVRVAAAPEDGKANRVLTLFFSELLRCPKQSIILKTGEKSRMKTLAIPRICEETLRNIIDNPKKPNPANPQKIKKGDIT